MRCPVHVAVEMELITAARPHFQVAGGGDGSEVVRESKERKIWRCPVPGCRQVSQINSVLPKRFICSKCGAPGDPEVHAEFGLLRCRECYRAEARENNRKLRQRRRSVRRGSVIGAAASVAARARNAAMAANSHRRGQAPSSKENLKRGAAAGGSSHRGVARIRIRKLA